MMTKDVPVDMSRDMSSRMAEVFHRLGLAWWVEVKTQTPPCTYYFGPFISAKDAETALPGYIQDLESEQAQGIVTTVKRCKPKQLTME